MKHILFCLFLFTIALNFSVAVAQTASIKIVNDSNKAMTFSLDDLKAMPQTILNAEAEDGTSHNYSGVEIQLLLTKAGFTFGKELRKQILNSYVLIKARDDYSVIYALPEIDTAFSNKKMILALTKDGTVLPENFGPFQIITTGEKKHARFVRMVTTINIRKVEQ